MTVAPAFFRSEKASRLLERAAAVAAVPVALHYRSDMEEELRIMGWGACAACRWVNDHDEGVDACRVSRTEAAVQGLPQDVPVTFVCHLGFTCVAAQALPASDYVLTFGPYLPAEAAEAIAHDVAHGLERITETPVSTEALPFSLEDIRIAPAGAVGAALEWLIEGLRDLYETYVQEDAPPEEADTVQESVATRHVQRGAEQEAARVEPAMAALALLCGRVRHARALIADALEEALLSGSPKSEQLQALVVAETTAILDAAGRMGGDVETAWRRFPAFVEAVRGLHDPNGMLKRAVSILRHVHADQDGTRPVVPAYLPEVIDALYRDHASKLQLLPLAEVVGVAPSSITRALEQRTGATFTELLGRVRIAQARRLLRATRLSAAAVGRRTGFEDQSNFGKYFLRYTGRTPGAYRRQFK